MFMFSPLVTNIALWVPSKVTCFERPSRSGHGQRWCKTTGRQNVLLYTGPVKTRCAWPVKPLDIAYHDEEWGVPVHDDRLLFEYLILEGAQAGLSWSTILARREGYRKAFSDFDVAKISRYSDEKIERLLLNPAIIRNRLKIESTVTNAKAFLKLQKE